MDLSSNCHLRYRLLLKVYIFLVKWSFMVFKKEEIHLSWGEFLIRNVEITTVLLLAISPIWQLVIPLLMDFSDMLLKISPIKSISKKIEV